MLSTFQKYFGGKKMETNDVIFTQVKVYIIHRKALSAQDDKTQATYSLKLN